MTLRFHPDVDAELSHLAAWYEQRREGLGADLQDDVTKALAAIVEHPQRWPLSRLAQARALGVRYFVVDRFPLTINYITDDATVLVLAVAHTSRRPDYWLRRIGAPKRKPPRRR